MQSLAGTRTRLANGHQLSKGFQILRPTRRALYMNQRVQIQAATARTKKQ